MVGVLSNRISREKLKRGDHIYSWRKKAAYLIAHHGIYVGDGEVIHFTMGDRGDFRSSSSDSSGPGSVESCTIDRFLSGGKLYIFTYGVSEAHFLSKRGGTCSLAASDPPVDVLHRAKSLLNNGFSGYDLFKSNCEDFAIYCKTGLLGDGSVQASAFVCGIFGAIFIPLIPFVGVPIFCAARLGSDISFNEHATKVPVESLASESCTEIVNED
ncbi:hypothetical protein U1Q18_039909 [Sarracenia purpurea var. burkii]